MLPDTSHHVTSINLVFGDDINTAVRKLSEAMNLNFGDFIPHMTLINAATDESNTFLEVASQLPVPAEIVVDSIKLFPDPTQDWVWISLDVRKTGELIQLRQQLIDLLQGHISSSTDTDSYWPHITLGCLSYDKLANMQLKSIKGIEEIRTIASPIIRIGRNGEYGKVIQLVSE